MANLPSFFNYKQNRVEEVKQKVSKLSPTYFIINTVTLNNKNAEIILLENYNIILETGDTSININYDFPAFDENIICNLYPYATVSAPSFTETSDATLSLSYIWKKIGNFYRLSSQIDARINRTIITEGGFVRRAIASYLTYKITVRNKKSWSEIEKVIT